MDNFEQKKQKQKQKQKQKNKKQKTCVASILVSKKLFIRPLANQKSSRTFSRPKVACYTKEKNIMRTDVPRKTFPVDGKI